MPSIHGSLSALQPLIDVTVADSAHDDREIYRALIDTGATGCCVSRHILHRHSFVYRTKQLIQVAGSHAARYRAYGFSLGLFCHSTQTDGATLYVWPDELIAPALLEAGSVDVILGMNFLASGRLVFDRRDFSFELPDYR